MGAVYRARDLHFPNVTKWVAVKEMINPSHDPTMREVMVQNFEREANILATLSHPSIPRIYDFFTHAQRSYLVEEFIYGEDLEAILRKSPQFLPEEQVITWAIELCDVLNFLHTHKPEPIIFRDMKPSNIMINQYNHVVLVDFGIAKAFRVGQRGTMMGTEGYSPPEQYRGEGSPLVDIYALGATLHHVLSRCNPQHEPPFTFAERPIRKYNEDISPDLEAVVNKALQYLPEDRFLSAGEMKDALTAAQNRYSAGSPAILPGGSSAVSAPGTVRPLWVFECEDEIRGSAGFNAGVVYFGALDNNLYALDGSAGKMMWKYPTRGGIVSKPAFLESFVYFGSEDGYLHVVSALSGRMVWTYRTGGPVRSSPRLTEEYLFIGSDDGHLHTVSINSGRKLWSFEVGGPIRSSASSESNLVYFGSETGDFFCLDLLGGQKWHYRTKRPITSSPLIYDGMVYFGSMDGTFYAFDARMGWEIWRYRLGKGTISSPCLKDRFVYTGSIDGKIYCLDITNGREIWTFQTEHQVTGSPEVVEDKLLCGSVDGSIYCLDFKTGRLRWKFQTKGPITGSPLVSDGVVYIGSTDHCVYALPLS
jgi:outer membrane protein assembly factor BamB/tRNA A-37 threonylcarbamoyl transferase component Bud32